MDGAQTAEPAPRRQNYIITGQRLATSIEQALGSREKLQRSKITETLDVPLRSQRDTSLLSARANNGAASISRFEGQE